MFLEKKGNVLFQVCFSLSSRIYDQEFKLNPHAKSFIPSQMPVRPQSPVSDGSLYFPPNVSAVPHMPGMPMGVGVSILTQNYSPPARL